MVNPLQRYKSVSVLILDDYSEFRLSLKQMVESFGVNHIDVCTNAEDALACYSEHYHDILLVDYNLGDGLNGLQLLAELNHRNLLKYGTNYVLITGETASDLVMGALEYRPDDYLAKPFTKTTLKSRLDKLVEKALAFKPIYNALNQKKPKTALSLCDQLMAENKRVSIECLRLKADIYLKQLNYSQALSIYNSILHKRELSWAQMGVAICYLALGESHKSLELCKLIVTKNSSAVEAYDLACECFIQQHDFESAYAITQKAIAHSPNSIIRQRQLAKLATRYNELEIAFNAYKRVLQLAKYSCLAQLDDYLHQLCVCTLIQIGEQNALARRVKKDFSSVYRAMTKYYPGIQSQLITETHQHFIEYLVDKSGKTGEKLMKTADKVASFPDPLNPVFVDLLEIVMKHADIERVTNTLDPLVTKEKAKLIAHDDPEKSENFNQQGMLKYKEKAFESAQGAFATALANAPNNPNIALNLLQAVYQRYKQQQKFSLTKRQFALSFNALKALAPNDHRYKQSQSLLNFAKAKLTE